MLGPSVATRFWTKVAISDVGCWEWRGGKNPEGYGNFSLDGRSVGAHVVAFMLTSGDVPDGMWVLHHCDNPSCVRPDHLYAGTHAENVADRDRRGRTLNGERHGATRLSDATVVEIRALYASGRWTQRALAETFGVSVAWVNALVHGRWRREAA